MWDCEAEQLNWQHCYGAELLASSQSCHNLRLSIHLQAPRCPAVLHTPVGLCLEMDRATARWWQICLRLAVSDIPVCSGEDIPQTLTMCDRPSDDLPCPQSVFSDIPSSHIGSQLFPPCRITGLFCLLLNAQDKQSLANLLHFLQRFLAEI